jgi:hypothetical protein
MQFLLHQLKYGAAVVLGRKICNPMATTCHQASRSAPVHVDDGGGFFFYEEGSTHCRSGDDGLQARSSPSTLD